MAITSEPSRAAYVMAITVGMRAHPVLMAIMQAARSPIIEGSYQHPTTVTKTSSNTKHEGIQRHQFYH